MRDLPPVPLWTRSAGRLVTAALLALAIAVVAFTPGSAFAVRSSRPVWGFLPTWDSNALNSFRHHAGQLAAILPTGLTLTGSGGLSGHLPHGIVGMAHSRGVRVMPAISNYRGGWDSAAADRVLRSSALRARFVSLIAGQARQGGWDGVNIDLESLLARDRVALPLFLGDLSRAVGSGVDVSVDVPAGPARAFDLHALGAAASHVLVMAYDRHASAGAPGAIAPPGFVAAAAGRGRRLVPASKLVIGLPSYAYAWSGGRPPRALSVDEALQLARREGVLPRWSPAVSAPWFSVGRGRARHVVWLADAPAFAADLRAAGGRHSPVAIWRLGGEDSGIWPLLRTGSLIAEARVDRLSTIPPPAQVRVSGSGDIMRVMPGSPGWRSVGLAGLSERYRLLPKPWRVQRTSGGGKRVAITFDDGPSATYTPQILAELQRLQVPATFFVIGENAAANPGLVQQEVAAGEIVGNHTFTHPNLATASDWRTRLEVAATTRVVTGLTGRRPALFRPPYAADASPTSQGEVQPLVLVQHLGETVVGASIDSQDYLRRGTQTIVSNVLAALPQGNIILFHDGGGDRSQTVAALPLVVRDLRARGYTIVSVPQLIGVSPAAAMPAVHGAGLWLSRAVAWAAESWFMAIRWIAVIGITLLAMLAARTVLLAALAIRHRVRASVPVPGPPPSVTVLVPAFNEATVIGRTLHSLLSQRGITPEIIVVDDGSSDGTAEAAEQPGVRVVRQANAGKWAALNRGVVLAQGDVVVAIDADTLLDSDAVARLARWFTDPRIGAVSGTAKVGNRHTLVTMWQHVEYTTGFNLDRRAYSDLNAITVVPGAIGAWRRSALIEMGGYSGRTLAEDCDLTVALRRAGWRIVYEPTAVAWTEAPETLRALARQRLRWTFGTFQVLWLNRGALFRRREGALGCFALPYAWLYQVVLSILAPAIDLIVLLAILTGGWTLALWWFAITSVAEMAVGWLAFRLEGEPAWPVLSLPLQRVVYRQLMYVTVIRSLARAARGKRLGWGKLARTGTVKAGQGG